jgi:Uri superfamily endonuclease
MTNRAVPVSYQLKIEVGAPAYVTVGRLGTFLFPAGRYVYTGSARRNIKARVCRHLTGGKSKRWHVDYLLAAPHVRITGVKLTRLEECALNRGTPGAVLFPGLGSSDCRSGCRSHLKYQGARHCGKILSGHAASGGHAMSFPAAQDVELKIRRKN